MSISLYDAIQTVMPVKTGLKIIKYNVSDSLPPTLIANNNPNRLELIISNVGDYDVYLNSSVAFDIPTGILLTPNGGFLSLIWNEDFDITGYTWYALADGGTAELTIMEVLSI